MTDKSELARVESFSDAVFAIAATLLVLELKMPAINNNLSTREVWKEIANLWPSYMAFLLSFVTILIIWINHHYTLLLINKTSKSFFYSNGFLLLTITFLPFPTTLLAQYISTKDAVVGVVTYSMACLLINFAFIIWWISMRKPIYIIKPEVTKSHIKKITTQLWIGLLIYIIATLISCWSPTIGIIIVITLDALWITLSLREKNITKEVVL
jgi:uncharacterized membrane protein